MPGDVRVKVTTDPLQIRVPHGLHADMVALIESEKRWSGRQEFVLEALREKIERCRRNEQSTPKREEKK
ncbi:MAG: hypothetical protein KGI98_14475 [Euryarchaeota archaeon]|nr:hypothetical protein [Euryarchaeota archaeon]MDE1881150.1 hypothetical protein [Euryarchaeota archaeon]